jgi:PncC family amidohydrolase
VQKLLAELKARQLTLAVAEGDTGGLLLAQLTAIPGSSAVVLGGVVAYADRLKLALLGVPESLLREYGAVSAQAAEAMARGVRQASGADIGVATTGIAGPGGATLAKAVGLAYVAVVHQHAVVVRQYHWSGDRASNRRASADAALDLVRDSLENTDNLEHVC